ncbi:MAG: transposase [Proteobacteria bacterium]|nr:transposase [Pseudomonadota bacterium]
MKKNRKKYLPEFKEEAVKPITEQGYQITEAARNLRVNPTMLGRWKREIVGSGYYAWCKCKKASRQLENDCPIPIVQAAHGKPKGTSGARRIAEEIRRNR